jgi:ribosome-associated heat shock protein Hsp15
MRLDVFLWYSRLAKTRAAAQSFITNGTVRLDGRRVEKPATPVHVGSILTFAIADGPVRAVRVEALPMRRGPAAEAQSSYAPLITVPMRVPGDQTIDATNARF